MYIHMCARAEGVRHGPSVTRDIPSRTLAIYDTDKRVHNGSLSYVTVSEKRSIFCAECPLFSDTVTYVNQIIVTMSYSTQIIGIRNL